MIVLVIIAPLSLAASENAAARIVRQVSDEEAIHFPECEIHRF